MENEPRELAKRLQAFHDRRNALRPSKDFLPDSPKAYYDLPDAAKCKVCEAGDFVVSLVNRMLVSGATVRDIHQTLKPIAKSLGITIGVSSIKTHQTQHLPYRKAALRKIAEANAALAQKDMIAGETSIITPLGLAEAMLHKGFESLADTEYVKPADALKAAQFVAQVQSEADASSEIVAQLQQQQSLIIAAIQEVTTQDQQEAILSYIRRNNPDFAHREAQEDYRNVPNPNHFVPGSIEGAQDADSDDENGEDDVEYVDMDALAGIREDDD